MGATLRRIRDVMAAPAWGLVIIAMMAGALALVYAGVMRWVALEERTGAAEEAINELRAERDQSLGLASAARIRGMALEALMIHRMAVQDHHLARCRLRIMDIRVAMDTLVTAWPRKARAVPPAIADWPDWPEVGGSIGSPMDPDLPAELARWRPEPTIEP